MSDENANKDDDDDDDTKSSALFDYQQTSICGLLLLSNLVCCLDTWLLLEAKFGLKKHLKKQQKSNLADNGVVIIDEGTVLRQYIVVRGGVVGGGRERFIGGVGDAPLDPSTIITTSNIPKAFMVKQWWKYEDIPVVVEGCGVVELEGLVMEMMCSGVVREGVIMSVIEAMVEARFDREKLLPLPVETENAEPKEKEVDTISEEGVRMIVEYGINLKILHSTREEEELNLKRLIHKTHSSLIKSRLARFPLDRRMKSLVLQLFGFDWFLALVFLLSSGDVERYF